jgi:hypothetical protein
MSGIGAALFGAQGGAIVATPAFDGATVTLGSNGSATGTGSSAWFSPLTSGIGGSYWFRLTRTGGAGGTAFSPASGAWHTLAAGQLVTNSGAGSCTGTIEFSTDSGGSSIVSTGSIAVNNAS